MPARSISNEIAETEASNAARDAAIERMFHRTWSVYMPTCSSCGEVFRVSLEAIKEMRESGYEHEDDEYLANSMEFCLLCVSGIDVPGEKPTDPRRVTLKSYKEHKALSQETTAYTTKIAIDGKVIGSASNDGQGGADLVMVDRESRPLWRSIVEKWNGANGNSPEPEAAFIAHLAQVIEETKIARRLFKQHPDTQTVVAVDTGKAEIGGMTYYESTEFVVFAQVKGDAMQAEVDRKYSVLAPRRIYTRETVS